MPFEWHEVQSYGTGSGVQSSGTGSGVQSCGTGSGVQSCGTGSGVRGPVEWHQVQSCDTGSATGSNRVTPGPPLRVLGSRTVELVPGGELVTRPSIPAGRDPDPASSWSVRPYRCGDEESLVRLFHQVFHRSITVDHWRWKFRGYATPVENVWLAADEEDQPVFHYAGIPCRLSLPTGEERVMVAVDAMTTRTYRRRGVFTTVVRHAHDEWRRAGIRLVLGLPNDRWGSRIQALGYVPLFPLAWRIRPLRPEALVMRRLGLAGLGRWSWVGRSWNRVWGPHGAAERGLEVDEVFRAGEELDALWRRVDAGGSISLVRDSQWVQWRYLESPQLRYRLLVARRRGEAVGYVAYRLDETQSRCFGFLPELVTAPGETGVWRALLRAALERLVADGAEAVATLAVAGTPASRALAGRGFLWSWGAFPFHTVFLDPGFPRDTLSDPHGWTLTGGEFDVL